MASPNVLILRAPGTNCDIETAYAFELAGGKAERVHINRLLETPDLAEKFQILCIPGGFSYGDDVAAGRVLACQIQHHLDESLRKFRDDGKLVLGICNGFQVLIKSGLLFEADEQGMPATLTWNNTDHFEDRWAQLAVDGTKSVFLQGIESMYLPVAHAEGKFVARDESTLARLADAGQLALRYAPLHGETPADLDAPLTFPDNPNGSDRNVAGACDATGRVLGLMPHPERHIQKTHHPRWTRGEGSEKGEGLLMFENAVGYFS
jgi:phosphoribosylformylglycinamidine synthase subunit PurQ / glutaminase